MTYISPAGLAVVSASPGEVSLSPETIHALTRAVSAPWPESQWFGIVGGALIALLSALALSRSDRVLDRRYALLDNPSNQPAPPALNHDYGWTGALKSLRGDVGLAGWVDRRRLLAFQTLVEQAVILDRAEKDARAAAEKVHLDDFKRTGGPTISDVAKPIWLPLVDKSQEAAREKREHFALLQPAHEAYLDEVRERTSLGGRFKWWFRVLKN